jgi:3-keto-disaccharide hydrolase
MMRTFIFWISLAFLATTGLVVTTLAPLQATYYNRIGQDIDGSSLMDDSLWEKSGGTLSRKFAGTDIDWIVPNRLAWTLPGHQAKRKLVKHKGKLLQNHQQFSAQTKEQWRAFRLTLEFRFDPNDETGEETRPEDFGNSGVYIFGLYEVQLLDTSRFVDPGLLPPGIARDGMLQVRYKDKNLRGAVNKSLCGSIYGGARIDDKRPELGATTDKFGRPFNYCRPSGQWNRMVIYFTPPEFSGKAKTFYPTIAVELNDQPVYFNGQRRFAISGPTGSQRKKADQPTGPIVLQDHMGKVDFRNIKINPLWSPPQGFALATDL